VEFVVVEEAEEDEVVDDHEDEGDCDHDPGHTDLDVVAEFEADPDGGNAEVEEGKCGFGEEAGANIAGELGSFISEIEGYVDGGILRDIAGRKYGVKSNCLLKIDESCANSFHRGDIH
jgi:hypothetical protein